MAEEYFNHLPPFLKKWFAILLGLGAAVTAIIIPLKMIIDLIDPYLNKDIRIQVMYKNQPILISSSYQLILNNQFVCEINSDKNIFICNVEKDQNYTAVLSYKGNKIGDYKINQNSIHEDFIVKNMPLKIIDSTYAMNSNGIITGRFRFEDISNGKAVSPDYKMKLILCDAVPVSLQNKNKDGIMTFQVTWNELNYYYYKNCKEKLDVKIEKEDFSFKDSIEKKFFFVGDLKYFDMLYPKYIKLDNEKIDFIGKIKQNDLTLIKDINESFALKFKTVFSTDTAITIQMDENNITINSNSIGFNDRNETLEDKISVDSIVKVEVVKENKKIRVNLVQNGKEISSKNDSVVLSSNEIKRGRIGYYYSGILKDQPILSIFDVSIQKQMPTNLSNSGK